MTESSESRHGIQVLDRANRLLARLEASSEPLALTTLARETGLSASTAHRILGSLSAMGFVKQNPAGQWSLGLRLLELGNLVYERFTVRQRALPFMQQLHAATGMTVNLAIRDNDRLLYIEHVLAPEYKANQLRRIGSWAPLHITSGGKLFLARMSPDEVRGYTERTGLKAGTQNSIQSLDHLLVTLAHARETGWAYDREEYESNVHCVAAPIFGARRQADRHDLARRPSFQRVHPRADRQALRHRPVDILRHGRRDRRAHQGKGVR